jgi:glycosyltransferase involved in cell wall biosynthesis
VALGPYAVAAQVIARAVEPERAAVTIYLPNLGGGGTERVNLVLAAELARRGIAVTLLLHRLEGALIAALPAGIQVVALGVDRTLAALPELVCYLRRARCDVLLTSFGHNNVVALWARALAASETTVVISQRNSLASETAALGTWQHRLLPFLYRRFWRWADGIVAISEGIAGELAALDIAPERITVIYNPVIDADFTARAGDPLDHPWFAPGGPPVILGVGRLAPQKDFAVLIRAFAQVRQHRLVRLVIIGEGPLRSELRRLAADLGVGGDVELAGFRINPAAFMKHAAVLVLTSRYEGFPNVLVESLACGTPVVSTDCPHGPAEILQHGAYGRLVPVQDVDALAAAIAATLANPPVAALLSARGRQFAACTAADQYLGLFSRTARSARAAGQFAAAIGGDRADGG